MSHSSILLSPPRLLVKGTVSWSQVSLPLSVLVDSGSDDNFIDSSFIAQSHIPSELLPQPKEVFALDGRLLARITHRTVPVSLLLSGNHHETISLYIIPSPTSPLVLGLPWLKLHNVGFVFCVCVVSCLSSFPVSVCVWQGAWLLLSCSRSDTPVINSSQSPLSFKAWSQLHSSAGLLRLHAGVWCSPTRLSMLFVSRIYLSANTLPFQPVFCLHNSPCCSSRYLPPLLTLPFPAGINLA